MAAEDDSQSPLAPLVEGLDYYFNESGFMVLSEHYLKRRGYCCENGCRHCPYGFKKKAKANV